MISDTYEEWAQAQIAAIVEYFGLDESDGRYSDVRKIRLPKV